MRNQSPFIVGFLVLSLATYLGAQQQTQPQPVANPENGFVPIFDGKTLKDWEGDPKYWRVEDGALVGEITPGHGHAQMG